MKNCKWPEEPLAMGLESEGRKRVLTLKTKPKYLGFAATPDQMGWVNEKVRLTPYVVVV